MIALPIMAEMNQSPHDQKNNATANMPDMLNVTSDEYNNVQASAIIPDLLPQEPDIEPIDVYDGSFPWDANNEFALKMYKNILEKNPDKNIFFSPTSIMIAMAMAYEGADGNTAQEMSNALHILPDDNTRRENIASAIKSINKQDVKNMVTNVVNSLWIKDRDFFQVYFCTFLVQIHCLHPMGTIHRKHQLVLYLVLGVIDLVL